MNKRKRVNGQQRYSNIFTRDDCDNQELFCDCAVVICNIGLSAGRAAASTSTCSRPLLRWISWHSNSDAYINIFLHLNAIHLLYL